MKKAKRQEGSNTYEDSMAAPLLFLWALFAGSAVAQTLFVAGITVNVPFDFVVNHTTLPAGEYVVSANNDGYRFIIQNKTEPKYGVFVVNNNRRMYRSEIQDQSRMVFALTNGHHVLHQIYLQGDDHTHDIVHGSDVIELARTR